MLERMHESGFKVIGTQKLTVTSTAQVVNLSGKQAIIYNASAVTVYIDGVHNKVTALATVNSFPIPVGASMISVTGYISLYAASGSNDVRLLIIDDETADNLGE